MAVGRVCLFWSILIFATNPIGPHHLVLLMVEDVTVSDALAGCVELDSHMCNLLWIGNDCLLSAALISWTDNLYAYTTRYGLIISLSS